jgi:hypothetical protein
MWDVYLVDDSCNVTRVTENVTPRIVVHPPAIADRMLLEASALPVNIKEST